MSFSNMNKNLLAVQNFIKNICPFQKSYDTKSSMISRQLLKSFKSQMNQRLQTVLQQRKLNSFKIDLKTHLFFLKKQIQFKWQMSKGIVQVVKKVCICLKKSVRLYSSWLKTIVKKNEQQIINKIQQHQMLNNKSQMMSMTNNSKYNLLAFYYYICVIQSLCNYHLYKVYILFCVFSQFYIQISFPIFIVAAQLIHHQNNKNYMDIEENQNNTNNNEVEANTQQNKQNHGQVQVNQGENNLIEWSINLNYQPEQNQQQKQHQNTHSDYLQNQIQMQKKKKKKKFTPKNNTKASQNQKQKTQREMKQKEKILNSVLQISNDDKPMQKYDLLYKDIRNSAYRFLSNASIAGNYQLRKYMNKANNRWVSNLALLHSREIKYVFKQHQMLLSKQLKSRRIRLAFSKHEQYIWQGQGKMRTIRQPEYNYNQKGKFSKNKVVYIQWEKQDQIQNNQSQENQDFYKNYIQTEAQLYKTILKIVKSQQKQFSSDKKQKFEFNYFSGNHFAFVLFKNVESLEWFQKIVQRIKTFNPILEVQESFESQEYIFQMQNSSQQKSSSKKSQTHTQKQSLRIAEQQNSNSIFKKVLLRQQIDQQNQKYQEIRQQLVKNVCLKKNKPYVMSEHFVKKKRIEQNNIKYLKDKQEWQKKKQLKKMTQQLKNKMQQQAKKGLTVIQEQVPKKKVKRSQQSGKKINVNEDQSSEQQYEQLQKQKQKLGTHQNLSKNKSIKKQEKSKSPSRKLIVNKLKQSLNLQREQNTQAKDNKPQEKKNDSKFI